jgi:type I pantothenate kinase
MTEQHATPSPEHAPTSRYVEFDRAQWARLRNGSSIPFSEDQLQSLVGLGDHVSLDEVTDAYLPLARLLLLNVDATRDLHQARAAFLETDAPRPPYVIAIAGSVAVGKSTSARILQELLARSPGSPTVELVPTDGFLYPMHELAKREITNRKGFPESYDVRALIQFMANLKAGHPEVSAPIYSHVEYDIMPNEFQVIRQPDIVIIEGLNVLQAGTTHPSAPLPTFVSDFFDSSIYVDADEADIEQWYVARFLQLRETVFQDPTSFFHRFAKLTEDEAANTARNIWRTINLTNLHENILPTRDRAHLILEKGPNHAIRRVKLRRL